MPVAEHELSPAPGLDREPALVQEPVMAAAQVNEARKLGLAAVARAQRAPNRRRNRPGLAADRERISVALGDRDQARIASEPAQHVPMAPAPLWGEIGPNVARVRVIFTAPNEEPRDLDVTVAHLTGELQERVGADHPFGVFVSFPPFESDNALELHTDGSRLEVVAYDNLGNEADRRDLLFEGYGVIPAHPPALAGPDR